LVQDARKKLRVGEYGSCEMDNANHAAQKTGRAQHLISIPWPDDLTFYSWLEFGGAHSDATDAIETHPERVCE
jgi:hypothetical protein